MLIQGFLNLIFIRPKARREIKKMIPPTWVSMVKIQKVVIVRMSFNGFIYCKRPGFSMI